MDTDLQALMRRTHDWVYDAERLDRMRATGVLQSARSPRLVALCERASDALATMAAAVTIIDGPDQVFLASFGFDPPPSDRNGTDNYSFCKFVGATGDTFAVDYAPENAIVCDLDSVSLLGVHAYLGVPLKTPDGEVVGSFCVFDDHLRNWTVQHETLLKDYSVLATAVLLAEQHVRSGLP